MDTSILSQDLQIVSKLCQKGRTTIAFWLYFFVYRRREEKISLTNISSFLANFRNQHNKWKVLSDISEVDELSFIPCLTDRRLSPALQLQCEMVFLLLGLSLLCFQMNFGKNLLVFHPLFQILKFWLNSVGKGDPVAS